MRIIIADTSALYALVDQDDLHHRKAVSFIEEQGDRLMIVVAEMTLFETITLVKSRLGHGVAAQALRAVGRSPRFRVVSLTDEDRTETWKLFEEFSDKAWSPFDCACLAVARARKIGEAFAFDKHFRQMADAGLVPVPT